MTMKTGKIVEFGSALDMLGTVAIGDTAILTIQTATKPGEYGQVREVIGKITGTSEIQSGTFGEDGATGGIEVNEIKRTWVFINGDAFDIDWDKGDRAAISKIEF